MTEYKPSLSKEVKPFVLDLLQSRLDNKLTGAGDVMEIAAKHQPPHGFSNTDWQNVCKFILLLENINDIPAAKKLADEYDLELRS